MSLLSILIALLSFPLFVADALATIDGDIVFVQSVEMARLVGDDFSLIYRSEEVARLACSSPSDCVLVISDAGMAILAAGVSSDDLHDTGLALENGDIVFIHQGGEISRLVCVAPRGCVLVVSEVGRKMLAPGTMPVPECPGPDFRAIMAEKCSPLEGNGGGWICPNTQPAGAEIDPGTHRVEWTNADGSHTGHGEPLAENLARAWVKHANEVSVSFGGEATLGVVITQEGKDTTRLHCTDDDCKAARLEEPEG